MNILHFIKFLNLILIIVPVLIKPSISQETDKNFDNSVSELGLSQRTIRTICQDEAGYMWFGTDYGLNRFDGYEFRVYLHDPLDSTSISDDRIVVTYKDISGILWVGTEKGGLNKYNPESDTFTRYNHDPADQYSISDDFVTAICEDRNGILWIGTWSGGINTFDRASNEFSRPPSLSGEPGNLENRHITAIVQDSLGGLWIGTNSDGIRKYDDDSDTIIFYRNDITKNNSVSSNAINSIYEDRYGTIWIGTEDAGLNTYNRGSDSFSHYLPEAGTSSSISSVNVMPFYDTLDGKLWIGTGFGLNSYDRVDRTFKHYFHRQNNIFSISNDYIISLFCDRSGLLWIGTMNGLTKLNPYEDKISSYSNRPDDKNSLSSNIVWGVHANSSDILWIGTNNGLNSIEREKGVITRFYHDPGDTNSLSSNGIISVFEDGSSKLWVGTDNGLNLIDPRSKNIKRYISDPNDPTSLSDNFVVEIYEDRNENIWIGTLRGGLNLYNRENNTFTRFQNDPINENSLIDNSVYAIYESKNRHLWIGTSGGLDKFDRESGIFSHFTNNPGNQNSLSHNRVTAILEDHNGILWLATRGGGLNKFAPLSGEFTCYSVEDGLESPILYGILEDNSGKIWISSDNGLSVFDPATEEFHNFRSYNTLHNLNFTIGSAFKNSDGEMFFGSSDGLFIINPEDLHYNQHIPSVVVPDFYVGNRSVIRNSSFNVFDEVSIPHQNNEFSIEFSALDFYNPLQNKYTCKLEGFDSDWINLGKVRSKNYMNLPYGEYIFKVRGSNSDDVWNRNGVSIKINVIPPFWRTLWFEILTLLVFFGVIYSLHKGRIKHKIRLIDAQKMELEQQVSMRTRELENAQELLEDRVEERTRELNEANIQLVSEINEREKMEETLRENEELFRSIFEFAPIGVVMTDLKGKYIVVNHSFCNLTGYTREELLEKTFMDITHPEDVEMNLKFTRKMAEGIISEYQIEKRYVHKNGDAVWINLNASLINDPGGNPLYFIGQILDITDQKKSIDEKKKLEDQLYHAQKMESIGRLAGGIAHDFNNILTSIIGYSELAKVEIKDEKSLLGNAISVILESSERAAILTKQLLGFARKGKYQPVPLELNRVINHVLKVSDRIFEKNIEVNFESGNINNVIADRSQIDQVLTNLFINAKDAMPDGGSIDINTKMIHLDDNFVKMVPEMEKGDYVLVSISDTGSGIPEELSDRIFEPFFTTKEEGKGTGLGLATVYSIIKNHGGHITVYSEVGIGTTFNMYLPVTGAKVDEDEEITATIKGEGRILLVDDEENIRSILKMQLEQLGYSILTAEDGVKGLDLYINNKDSIDLVLLDMIMPNMAGKETFLALKGVDPDIKVLLMSGFAQKEKTDSIINEGVVGFIQKPFRLQELSRILSTILGESKNDN